MSKEKADFIPATDNNANKKDVKKATKQKDKKPGFFKRLGARLKDTFAELKKVSWPTFMQVVKRTGIVLVVVLLFLVVITAFDFGLSQLIALAK